MKGRSEGIRLIQVILSQYIEQILAQSSMNMVNDRPWDKVFVHRSQDTFST